MEVVGYSIDTLFECFTNDYCVRSKKDQEIIYIYEYLEELGCKKIVVEEEYVDKEFLEDYSHYYSKCFRSYNRYCKRLHFFKDLDGDKLVSYFSTKKIDKSYHDTLQKNYLGYIVVKPLPDAIIGRTVLSMYSDTVFKGEDKDEKGKRSIRCVHTYTAHLNGIELTVDSLAFQEQDTVVGACATSALWSALQHTSSIFNCYTPTLYEITTEATKFMSITRPIPSTGLTPIQIAQAIKSIGLEPEFKEYTDPSTREVVLPLLNVCYSYLRSGIPIIMGVDLRREVKNKEGNPVEVSIGQHAITLTGYRLSEKGKSVLENECGCINEAYEDLRFIGSKITSFYAHDDQIGPFSSIAVGVGDNGTIEFDTSWTYYDPEEKKDKKYKVIPTLIIIPIYHKVRIPINTLLKPINQLSQLIQAIKVLPTDEDKLEWDSYLCCVNSYKKEILDSDILNKPDILNSKCPKYMWRFVATYNNTPLLEIMVDATDMERSFQMIRLNFFNKTLLDYFHMIFFSEKTEKLVKPYLSDVMYDFMKKEIERNHTD